MNDILSAMEASRPLCVDLDGTFSRTDTLWEQLAWTGSRHPFRLLSSLGRLPAGKSEFKRAIAENIPADALIGVANPVVVEVLEKARSEGREIILVTATDQKVAEGVAARFSFFDKVMGSTPGLNLKGENKAEHLVKIYGRGQFDYIGDSVADVPVWAACHTAYVVSTSNSALGRRAAAVNSRVVPLPFQSNPIVAAVKCARPHQWVKNILLFLPLLASRSLDPAKWLAALEAFVAFSFLASAVYLLNDIADLQHDRLHPRKQRRPIASGSLSIPLALILAAILAATALGIAGVFLSIGFFAFLCSYVVISKSYSVYIKKIPIYDVFTLSSLYLLRVFAGGQATATVISTWLLGFTFFLFLSLAVAKRVAELQRFQSTERLLVPGRGYFADDRAWLVTFGTSIAGVSVLVLTLYVNSPEVSSMYHNVHWLWGCCAGATLWLARLWFMTSRGEMHDDPVVFALKDRTSYFICAISAAFVWLAI